MVSTKLAAARSEACVPVSSQAMPRPSSSTRSVPREIGAVDVGDLQLPAGGGLELSSELDAARVVEVKARDRVGRARRCGLLRQIDNAPAGIELHHPVALGIAHVVGEHRSLGAAGGG